MTTRPRDLIILAVMPLFFVSNLIIGRPAVDTVPPWTLAALRWSFACLILAPFALPAVRQHAATLIAQWKLIALLGFLGMWICGGIVYVALQYTTATHGTLIYTASPVIVVLLAALLARRPLPLGQTIGVLLGIAGVFTIVLEGQPLAILSHHFNVGDLWFVLAAIAWAVYSLLLKNSTLQTVPTMALFFVIALAGAILLVPCMIAEWWLVGKFPSTLRAWASIAGIVIFSSVLSFSTYQYGIKKVGPALTSIFLYLLPVYGIVLAVIFLGETFRPYHAIGLVLVLGGIILATAPSFPRFKA
ncbi:MAG: DMT family transporter [Pseudorhodoplanes sp.]|nr:DMT family transporter [Pseudorhodoplanes sp.]